MQEFPGRGRDGRQGRARVLHQPGGSPLAASRLRRRLSAALRAASFPRLRALRRTPFSAARRAPGCAVGRSLEGDLSPGLRAPGRDGLADGLPVLLAVAVGGPPGAASRLASGLLAAKPFRTASRWASGSAWRSPSVRPPSAAPAPWSLRPSAPPRSGPRAPRRRGFPPGLAPLPPGLVRVRHRLLPPSRAFVSARQSPSPAATLGTASSDGIPVMISTSRRTC